MEKPWFKDLSDREVLGYSEWSWWDWAAHDQKSFKLAFEALVAAKCDGWVLLDTLGWIRDRLGIGTTSSPDDIRRIREGLQQGLHALDELLNANLMGNLAMLEERLLLRYSRDEAKTASKVLRDLSNQLKPVSSRWTQSCAGTGG